MHDIPKAKRRVRFVAFVDTLAKALLTGLPEQSSASVARGKERYPALHFAALLKNPWDPLRIVARARTFAILSRPR